MTCLNSGIRAEALRWAAPGEADRFDMGIAKVRPGQVWMLEGTGESWLVTKVYSEAFSSYVMLRKVGGGDNDVRRLKVTRSDEGVALVGFKFSQELDQF